MIAERALIYALGTASIPLIARAWVRFRQQLRERREAPRLLFDGVLLEVALTPRQGDDADVLAELRETLSHLNRRRYAEEFWGLDEQLEQYYQQLPLDSRPTLQRALLRLIDQPDRWLQGIAARTSARLCFTEAVEPLRRLAQQEANGTDARGGAAARFGKQIQDALEKLEGCGESLIPG